MAKSYSMFLVLGAALAGGFQQAFDKAGKDVGGLQKKLLLLSQNEGHIKRFQKLQGQITTNQAAMMAMRKETRTLAIDGAPAATTAIEKLNYVGKLLDLAYYVKKGVTYVMKAVSASKAWAAASLAAASITPHAAGGIFNRAQDVRAWHR